MADGIPKTLVLIRNELSEIRKDLTAQSDALVQALQKLDVLLSRTNARPRNPSRVREK